jgi:hypothetical protein
VAQFLRASGIAVEQLMLALIPQAQQAAIPLISNFFVGAEFSACRPHRRRSRGRPLPARHGS